MGLGNKSDQPGYEQTGLAEIIEILPAGLFIAADAAYIIIITAHILIPFTLSQQCQDQVKDAFDFFLRQLHIRIENTGSPVGKDSMFSMIMIVNGFFFFDGLFICSSFS
jgi:hypothetical protein